MPERLMSAGRVDLGNLPNVWSFLDDLDAERRRVNDAYSIDMGFTDRRFDESRPTGKRMYITASHLLSVARDNQKALEEMMEYRGIRPFATWNLIRPAFENSSYVVWMLEPDDGLERMRRALRLAWQEQRQHGERLKLAARITGLTDHPDTLKAEAADRETKRKYEEEARNIGLGRQLLGAKPNLTDEIPKLKSLVDDEVPNVPLFHALKWRELSGIQHGDMGAVLTSSDAEYRLPIPGGMTAVVSVNDESLVAACYAAAAMQLEALRLYVKRSTHARRHPERE